MRLFTKIFLFGMLVLGLAFSASGYFLLRYSMESSLAREADFALKQFQYDKFTVQSAMLTATSVTISLENADDLLPEANQTYTIRQFFPDTYLIPEETPGGNLFGAMASELSVPAAFYSEDKTLLYSNMAEFNPSFLDSLSKDAHTWQFCRDRGGFVLVGTMLRRNALPVSASEEAAPDSQTHGQYLYFVTQWDISRTLLQQNTLRQYFLRCYLVAMVSGMALLIIFSTLLTGPLNRMSKAARRIAKGDYAQRLSLSGQDEIGTLAESFNQMADAVEEKIAELAKAARDKEDFVANFAHELKTPLTSIIGYADTIYQKELSREETRRASWHIWNEGMRLESLSLKLMELTVLNRQDFPLTQLPADELLQDVAEGLSPLLEKRQIDFHLQAEPACVLADYDLLKTLLLNLTDNSIKAGADRIALLGKAGETPDKYLICVSDNGCGMEPEELSRITEAFYMVDKARSRKQHGAGLGLSLADRVAEIHGDRLRFASKKDQGTQVSFSVRRIASDSQSPDCASNHDGLEGDEPKEVSL